MYAWKFIVPASEWRTLRSDPNVQFKGCSAVALAETEDGARTAVERFAAEFGHDARWLEVADVRRLLLVDGATLAFTML